MWTLRLRGPKGKAATVQIASDARLRELCELATSELAIKGAGTNLHLTFRSGFPPRVVAYDLDDAVQLKFTNNDTIVVDTAAPSAEPRQAAAPPSTATTCRPTTRGVAASVARATAKPKAATKPKEPARGVHSLHSAKPKGPTKRKDRGDGVRLGASLEEESVVVDAAPEPKYRRTETVHLSSKDDIGVALAKAVSGQSHDRVGKFFRAATKSAVDHQYEIALANARLKAALSKQFEIQPVSEKSELRVKFKERARKWKEETVTWLEPLELQAALKYILISGGETGREMLKPFNMAQLSPRVFWNIARLYDGDIEAGMAVLVPDEDWSYLDTRSRQMSKKAMEAKANEEIYKRWKETGTTGEAAQPVARRANARSHAPGEVIEIGDSNDDNTEEKTSAEQLQMAMAYAEQAEKRSLREPMARAAATRVEARARAHEVTSAIRERSNISAVSTVQAQDVADDTESAGEQEDEDDDVEKTTTVYCDKCNKARILSLSEAATAGVPQDGESTEWTCATLAAVGRDGTCGVIDDEIEQIAGEKLARLLQQVAIHTRHDLANASLTTAMRGLSHPLDPNYAEIKIKVQELIDEARLDEVNDAMDDIVGRDLVGVLELQKLGTPADLVETPADLVVTAVASRKKKTVDIDLVQQWQAQAREKIAQSPWMGEWRTI